MTTNTYDLIIVGAGVVGCSTAFHASQLGAKVLLVDSAGIAEGTSAQSSGILRTHYSVRENVALAHQSYAVFENFANYVQNEDAASGFNRCGYLIVADEAKADAVKASIAQQAQMGIAAELVSAEQAVALLPLLDPSGLCVFGYEPDAGYADAYLVATGFASAARRLGARIQTNTPVQSLIHTGTRVTGVQTTQGSFYAACVLTAANVWSNRLLSSLPQLPPIPLLAQRHEVIALEAPLPYLPSYPVFKDMASPGMLYARSYGRSQLLVSKGTQGPEAEPDEGQADVPLDLVADIGEQIAMRLPSFAQAGLVSSWTGLYDVTPDWNPVLGALPGWAGLQVAFGFSGHGFKLSPMVGKLLAQSALGLPTEVDMQPYRYMRFAQGAVFEGLYVSTSKV